jgi:hypothetical protein
LPFKFFHRESYALRLLAEDWVGVVPEEGSLRYAWQEFPKEWMVADAIHISRRQRTRAGQSPGRSRMMMLLALSVPNTFTSRLPTGRLE